MKYPYIDTHCDTLMSCYTSFKKDIYYNPKAMVDVQRLKSSNCKAQFFAIFMPPIDALPKFAYNDDKYINKLHKALDYTIKKHGDDIAWAENYLQMQENFEKGKVSAFLTLEDGRAIQGDFNRFQRYIDMGVRLVSLTWNHENCFGFPNSFDPVEMQRGLKDFGKEAISFMNDKKVIIDISHLSDKGFWEVLELSNKPVIASHSSCRTLTPHPRNLTDEMIKALAEKGGVAGINFGPQFVNKDIHSKDSNLVDIVAHIKHMANVGGIDCVGIGSDFDGISGNLEVNCPTKLENIWTLLEKEGFTSSDIEKVAYKNMERVIQEVL